jgi:hypothetical protein
MIYYKNAKYLHQSSDAKFDAIYEPGVPTPYSGVYHCVACLKEVTSVHAHPLPPQNHHQHPAGQPIRWQMVVWG